MSKEIEVYNAYFGDCIMLKEYADDSNLLIDFGIHYFSDVPSAYVDRTTLTASIADDLAMRYSNNNTSLLITHFHEDHISGLIHMYKNGDAKFKRIFKKAYIANIWNNPFAVAGNILEELLLEYELKMSGLPRTTSSLFDVLDFLCGNVCRVELLSRGQKFEKDKYITLWPPLFEDKDEKITDMISALGMSDEFAGRIMALSEMACIYMGQYIQEYSADRVYSRVYFGSRIEDMRTMYRDLVDDFVSDNHILDDDLLKSEKQKLNELNHKYNIVFQNAVSGDENILFAGDAEKRDMNEIAKATDIKLHETYKYIKIPHHGTEGHYFDFSKYKPQNVLITNGKVNVNNGTSYEICKGYGNLNSIHLCTNTNNCSNCTTSCLLSKSVCAKGRKIVYSKLYESI